jgi:hypothetical protein
MEQLSLERCRELIGDDGADLTDEQVQRLRRELYELAEVVADAFESLEIIDRRLLEPEGDLTAQALVIAATRSEDEAIEYMRSRRKRWHGGFSK